MKIDLTYGSEKVSFEVPDESLTKESPMISPRKVEVTKEMSDIEGSIKRALENPKGSKRLKDLVSEKRVGLVVADEFRSGKQEMIIKHMLLEIAEGSPKEVFIFCATGSHDPEIYAKNIGIWVEKYATEAGLTFKFFGHDCIKDEHVEIGKCSDGTPIRVIKELLTCEVRAYGHESKHHYMNGYSCIDKLLLPGVSHSESIALNHKNALDHVHSFGGRNVWAEDPSRQKNPFSIGISEARELADKTYVNESGKIEENKITSFGLDMISDAKHIYWIESGDIKEISKEMTKEVDKLSMFKVGPAKTVIVSPGGPPASQTIYSTQNCFDMALSGSIEDGGEALVIAPCEGRPDVPEDVRGLAPDKKAKKLFYDNLANMIEWPIEKSTKWIDENFELYLWKTDRVLKLLKLRNIKLYLYSTLSDEKVKAIGFTPVKDIQKWINERKNSSIRIVDQGNKILVTKKSS